MPKTSSHKIILGPLREDWLEDEKPGDCPECGGQCSPECGYHPMGCMYGGPTEATAYWMKIDGCPLYHGWEDPDA